MNKERLLEIEQEIRNAALSNSIENLSSSVSSEELVEFMDYHSARFLYYVINDSWLSECVDNDSDLVLEYLINNAYYPMGPVTTRMFKVAFGFAYQFGKFNILSKLVMCSGENEMTRWGFNYLGDYLTCSDFPVDERIYVCYMAMAVCKSTSGLSRLYGILTELDVHC